MDTKYRILRKNRGIYVQMRVFIRGSYEDGECSYEWQFVRHWYFGPKVDFVIVQCAEEYIESCLNDCEGYTVVKEYR